MTEENNEQSSGGIVTCSAEFSKDLDKFAELFEGHGAPKREAARFAMAIGIQKGLREKRSEWKKPTEKQKISTIAHLYGQFDDKGRFDFDSLFDILDLKDKDDDTPIQHLISEYVTGGMRYIKDNELNNLDEWSRMKDDFPHLFTQED